MSKHKLIKYKCKVCGCEEFIIYFIWWERFRNYPLQRIKAKFYLR